MAKRCPREWSDRLFGHRCRRPKFHAGKHRCECAAAFRSCLDCDLNPGLCDIHDEYAALQEQPE